MLTLLSQRKKAAKRITGETTSLSSKYITTLPIDVMKLINNSGSHEAGGLVVYIGEVRNNNLGRKVEYVEYEAFIPQAERIIEEIVNAAVRKWKLIHANAVHRIGKLEVSESAVAVLTIHNYRNEAYEANQYIIDRLKNESPVWKKEYYRDGTYSWADSNHFSNEELLKVQSY